MGIFNKLFDFATGTSYNYEREDEVYTLAIERIEAIENLLDFYIKDEGLRDYSSLYKKIRLKIIDLNNQIIISKRNLSKAKTDREYQQMMKKINYLVESLDKLIDKFKNELLLTKDLIELINHVSELQVIINGNARLEPFKDYVDYNYFTINDLIDIRERIADRRCVIIDYIGNINRH